MRMFAETITGGRRKAKWYGITIGTNFGIGLIHYSWKENNG